MLLHFNIIRGEELPRKVTLVNRKRDYRGGDCHHGRENTNRAQKRSISNKPNQTSSSKPRQLVSFVNFHIDSCHAQLNSSQDKLKDFFLHFFFLF